MTELSEKILESFQVRKTKKQKDAFIRLMQIYFPELQVQTASFPKSRNLVLGNPESAQVILGAHYDTCAKLPFPNFITPKKPFIAIAYSIIMVLPMILIMFLAEFLLVKLFPAPALTTTLPFAIYLAFMWLMLAGPANQHTANDNTSGVITLLEIYDRLPEELREKVCFVFFDNEEKGVIGSGQFRSKYKKQLKSKLMVNFDCVSDGDNFLVAISKKAEEKYHEVVSQSFPSEKGKIVLLESLKKVYYPSDQAGFPQAIAIAALNYKKPFGYYMDKIHTKQDTVFQQENIEYLAEHTIALIKQI